MSDSTYVVATDHRQEGNMKCSNCGNKGHNTRTCASAKGSKASKPADLGSVLSAEHDVAEAARVFVRLSRARDEGMWDALSALGTAVELLEEEYT